MRKPSKKGLKRKADQVFSAWIRSRNVCQWCGAVNETLQAAHVFSRKYLVTRWTENNCFCLCVSCHFKAHAQPIEFAEFVKMRLGTRKYNDLRLKARTSVEKVDLESVIAKYQGLLDTKV